MSLDKAELKILILNELGCDFEDMCEVVRRETHQQEGAAVALRVAAKTILGLSALVDDDLDKGRYELEEAGRIKSYIGRAATQCEEMSKDARNKRMVSEGRTQGIAQVVATLKKKMAAETVKADARKNADPSDSRALGTRPGLSVAQQRKAEELQAKAPPVKKKVARKRATRKKTGAANTR